MAIRLSEKEFARLVDKAMTSLPEQFAPYLENLIVEIRPWPTPKQLEHMDLEEDETLLGLYQGVPLTEKTVTAPIDWPERIYIFQRPIEEICETPEQVVRQVQTTVLHEVGHHFGMDEDDLDELGYT